ncbi:stage III sporulation protein AF [Gracilibacillus lacisalsi]|uniref:stage III sporulation protein AF n=1 Tax=Gracilibacillus lacisalsi TaxID=393087 RepID=UPI0024800404|nr:stage III sporulation protein AF [Gracilibacillus lacisalsi]
MEYLSSWILQIIIYMILAMIVDLILPSSTLKQYVKLVVGLLLILIILQPLLSVFNVNVHQMVDQIIPTNSDSSVESEIENGMNQQKSEIEKIQAAYVLEEMVVQMENIVEEELQETYNYQIEDMEVDWASHPTSEENELERIYVQLVTMDDDSAKVEEVHIQIGDSLPQTSESPPDDANEIKNFLADQWGVEEEIIHIRWKEE